MLSARLLVDHLQCPSRPVLDARLPAHRRDETSAFIEMLWEQSRDHDPETLAALGITADLSATPRETRGAATLAAMARGEAVIYQGLLEAGELSSAPHVLQRQADGGYSPGILKAGRGTTGEDAEVGSLKLDYAIELAHASHLLEQLGLGGSGHRGFVIGGDGERVDYDLDAAQGPRKTQTWFEAYHRTREGVLASLQRDEIPRPALSATCKLCHWYSHCKAEVQACDDLTRIPELGRAKRDSLVELLPTVHALASADLAPFIRGKQTVFPGVGPETLRKYQTRARLLTTSEARPMLKAPLVLPIRDREVFFDIEADPFRRNFVYLHGLVERPHGDPARARFHGCFAEGNRNEDEEAVFAHAWRLLTDFVEDSVVYYYSQYEPTAYRRLARKYPGVCSPTDVVALFARPEMIDLYKIVREHTEWPCQNLSIKTLAVYCGFAWRDESPSGAASIEWYRRWLETGDPAIRARIADYNEDDCLATGVIVDALRALAAAKLSA